MGRPKKPKYEYVESLKRYRKRDSELNDGKPIYGRTVEELEEKIRLHQEAAAAGIDSRKNPTVSYYIEKWTRLHSQNVRPQTIDSYMYPIKHFILPTIGDLKVKEVTTDDVKEALYAASEKSRSVYDTTDMILKMVFGAAVDSNLIAKNPCPKYKTGGNPPKPKSALTNEQVNILLESVKGTTADTFVQIAVYTGMRREEIIALKWDRVFLDVDDPFIRVNRSCVWSHNRPQILDELKTDAAERDIPLPEQLINYLRELKNNSTSEFLIHARDNTPLTETGFRNLWHAVVCRTEHIKSTIRTVK